MANCRKAMHGQDGMRTERACSRRTDDRLDVYGECRDNEQERSGCELSAWRIAEKPCTDRMDVYGECRDNIRMTNDWEEA